MRRFSCFSGCFKLPITQNGNESEHSLNEGLGLRGGMQRNLSSLPSNFHTPTTSSGFETGYKVKIESIGRTVDYYVGVQGKTGADLLQEFKIRLGHPTGNDPRTSWLQGYYDEQNTWVDIYPETPASEIISQFKRFKVMFAILRFKYIYQDLRETSEHQVIYDFQNHANCTLSHFVETLYRKVPEMTFRDLKDFVVALQRNFELDSIVPFLHELAVEYLGELLYVALPETAAKLSHSAVEVFY
jgi:hypothetical protein